MESRNGALCRTGRVAEADSDLHRRSNGKIEREGVVTSDPETIAAFVKSHAPHVARIGLEAGATSTWLWTELNKMGLPVICIDARHAKAALKMQINKSDRNDAVGIARIMQCGWYKEVRVKDLDSHAIKALLVSRALLVKIKRDIENQIRGLLKNLGLVIGRAKMNVFACAPRSWPMLGQQLQPP
jgi:Transposase and inactivated derivatives